MDNLQPRHYRALTILATGGTIENAAKACGVSIPSIKKWKTHPNFKNALRECTVKVFETTIAKLVLEADESIQKLTEIIRDDDVSAKVKVSAISLLLNIASKSREFALTERIEKLEKLLESE